MIEAHLNKNLFPLMKNVITITCLIMTVNFNVSRFETGILKLEFPKGAQRFIIYLIIIVLNFVFIAVLGINGMLTQKQSSTADEDKTWDSLKGSGLRKYKGGS